MDPGTPLGVAQAARLAGVAQGQLRDLMEAGKLLFEVQRRKGKEVQLVRYVDLMEAFPERFGVPEPAPEPAPERAPEPESVSGLSTDPAILEEAQRILGGQLEDLTDQRRRLREQGDELRQRLILVEQERQASTAGLLMMQRRMLELEAGPVVSLAPAMHRRPSTWGALAGVVLLLMTWSSVADMRSALAAEGKDAADRVGDLQRVLKDQESRAEGERLEASAELDKLGQRLNDRDRAMLEAQATAKSDREGFQASLEAAQEATRVGQAVLADELRLERERSAQDREGALQDRAESEQRIEVLREQADQAWLRLDDERRKAGEQAVRDAQRLEQSLGQARAARLEMGQRLDQLSGALQSTEERARATQAQLELERSARARLAEYMHGRPGARRPPPYGPVELFLRVSRTLAPGLGQKPSGESQDF
ncbi:MAG: hypothetical protein ACI9HE_000521 [Planctomycetota bacterium]|jgi:hypothetical protein